MRKANKSTANQAQRDRIIKALSVRPRTSYELRKMGCYMVNSRIVELRRQGYDISTTRVTIWDDQGYPHNRVALYVLNGGSL